MQELRSVIAAWFEKQQWAHLDVSDAANAPLATSLLQSMLAHLQAKTKALRKLSHAPQARLQLAQLTKLTSAVRKRYASDPLGFVATAQQCHAAEQEIMTRLTASLDSAAAAGAGEPEPGMDGDASAADAEAELVRHYLELDGYGAAVDQSLASLEQLEEAFRLDYMEHQAAKAAMGSLADAAAAAEHERAVRQKHVALARQSQSLLDMRAEIKAELEAKAVLLNGLQSALGTRLSDWQEQQWRRSVRESRLTALLGLLRGHFVQQSVALWSLRERLVKLRYLHELLPATHEPAGLPVDALLGSVEAMLESLVQASLVITRQPPQVVRRAARFAMTIELLVDARLLTERPVVTAELIDEATFARLCAGDCSSVPFAGSLLNNSKRLETQRAMGGSLAADFPHVCIKDHTAPAGESGDGFEPKFGLLVHTSFAVGPQKYETWVCSTPVAIVGGAGGAGSGGLREAAFMAEATMFWDAAFGAWPRVTGWTVSEAVTSEALGEALSRLCEAETERGLEHDQRACILAKVAPAGEDVSWQRLAVQPLDGRGPGFTLWAWFYSDIELARTHLQPFWREGAIVGFVPKPDVAGLLAGCAPGTFLLRFSDSLLGAISVCLADTAGRMMHLQPWLGAELATISLADRIRQTPDATVLYPLMRAGVFDAYATPDDATGSELVDRGYVETGLRMTVKGAGSREPSAAPFSGAEDEPTGRTYYMGLDGTGELSAGVSAFLPGFRSSGEDVAYDAMDVSAVPLSVDADAASATAPTGAGRFLNFSVYSASNAMSLSGLDGLDSAEPW